MKLKYQKKNLHLSEKEKGIKKNGYGNEWEKWVIIL